MSRKLPRVEISKKLRDPSLSLRKGDPSRCFREGDPSRCFRDSSCAPASRWGERRGLGAGRGPGVEKNAITCRPSSPEPIELRLLARIHDFGFRVYG
ncbi:hypothetical protein T484DRAFT_1938547 [Baffinella frigidus]|nr:hypothetical protein T484DRAFT_1938547 [Cryptophyta sp. CCMP2293]